MWFQSMDNLFHREDLVFHQMQVQIKDFLLTQDPTKVFHRTTKDFLQMGQIYYQMLEVFLKITLKDFFPMDQTIKFGQGDSHL